MSSTTGPEHRIRRLVHAELPACQELAHSQGWSAEGHKWRLLFDIGEVYGLFDRAGALLSTATLARYGPDLAAISMVLTDPRHTGRGLAAQVMRHVMKLAGDATVTLYATDNGRPLYEKLGFVTAATNTMYRGVNTAVPAGISRPATADDLPAMIELDAGATGGDRGDLVTRLFGFTTDLRVVERDGAVTGYAGAWRNDDSLVIGPVIAADSAHALGLIADIAAPVAGAVRLEVRSDRPGLGEWALAHGLSAGFETSFMVHDGRDVPGEARFWFSPVMVALG